VSVPPGADTEGRTQAGAGERSPLEHRFGPYGGQFVPETLMPALAELEQAWLAAREDPAYRAELNGLLRDFGGRPTPLYRARRFSERAGRPVYLKREDLNHTGSHKLNNALGQVLLARRMGKRRIIAETGAGQPPCVRCSAWSVWCTWALRTRAASDRTCRGWSCLGPGCSRWTLVRGR